MVVEPWLMKMGNQVSSNFKNSFLSQTKSKRQDSSCENAKQTIGILSFEVANVMSKLVHLHKSVSHKEICKLKNETIKSEGVKKLVSCDESFLLELAYAERLDDLNRLAEMVSRLGKKCTEPALQGFEHVYGDIKSGKIEVRELGFVVKDMESMVRKMERYVGSTANLYRELEALNELEYPRKKRHLNGNEESRQSFELKLSKQRQDVKRLKLISLWSQTYDKVVELLARTICTIYARTAIAFNNDNVVLRRNYSGSVFSRSHLLNGKGLITPLKTCDSESIGDIEKDSHLSSINQFKSSTVERSETKPPNSRTQMSLRRGNMDLIRHQDLNLSCGPSPTKILMECLSLSNSVSRLADNQNEDDFSFSDQKSHVSGSCSTANGMKKEQTIHSGSISWSEVGLPCTDDQKQFHCLSGSLFGPSSRLATHATPSTVGGSALALHYANIIIFIEKILCYPHLVRKEARDDLYQMLPSSLRDSLRANLKLYSKTFAMYDASLAHNWKETLDGILKWLAPLAHNMIRWQSERNFEKQQQIVSRTNVLLLQTLYLADRDKTEAIICELMVGLDYICRYEQQQCALLNCASSFDFGGWKDWQLQCKASCLNQ